MSSSTVCSRVETVENEIKCCSQPKNGKRFWPKSEACTKKKEPNFAEDAASEASAGLNSLTIDMFVMSFEKIQQTSTRRLKKAEYGPLMKEPARSRLAMSGLRGLENMAVFRAILFIGRVSFIGSFTGLQAFWKAFIITIRPLWLSL